MVKPNTKAFNAESAEKKEKMENTEKKRKDSGAVFHSRLLCGLFFLFFSVTSVFNL